jgi:hypothetical protein
VNVHARWILKNNVRPVDRVQEMRTKGGVAKGTIQTSHIDDCQPLQRKKEHGQIARKELTDV